VVYFLVFGAGIVYMLKLIAKGPQPYEPKPTPSGASSPGEPIATARRPLSAAIHDRSTHFGDK
jgi:cytochrome d ubiquinol oxidase subunit I